MGRARRKSRQAAGQQSLVAIPVEINKDLGRGMQIWYDWVTSDLATWLGRSGVIQDRQLDNKDA